MEEQTKVGIGAAAVIALMSILEPHLFESHPVIAGLIYVAFGGTVLWGFAPLAVRLARKLFQRGLKGMWPQYVMVLGGCISFIGLVAFLQFNVTPPSHKSEDPPAAKPTANKIDEAPAPPKFSWAWEPFTEKQIDETADRLKKAGPQSITLVFSPQASGRFAASLKQAFERAGWKANWYGPSSSVYLGGLTGLAIYPNSATPVSEAIIGALDGPLKPNFVELRHSPPSPALLIGGKPVPSPLPPEIERDARELGGKLRALSDTVGRFAADRKETEDLVRKNSLNLPSREAWQASVDASGTTERLLNERFGAALNENYARLQTMGIDRAWQVTTSRDPGKLGKWLGMVGALVGQGNILDARRIAADNDFWFSQ